MKDAAIVRGGQAGTPRRAISSALSGGRHRSARAARARFRRRCTPSTETARHRARRCRTRGRRSGATPAAPFALPRAIDPASSRRQGRGEELQRDRGAQLEIVRAVDDAHAAATEQADHPVAATEHGAGREGSAEGVNVRDDSGQRQESGWEPRRVLVRRSRTSAAARLGTAAPHDPQKRCATGTSAEQAGQRIGVRRVAAPSAAYLPAADAPERRALRPR